GRIGELEILSESERHQLEVENNDSEERVGVGEEEERIEEMVRREAERGRDRIAVVKGERRVSYGEMERRAEETGRRLRREGVRAEELVGVSVKRREELIETLLGILKAGGGYVPIDEEYPRERKEYMVKDAGMRMVIVEGEE